ncbi:hypothetical protein BMW23_0860 [Bodo saltans virus]|uniref:Uncharacterized protein n=1 Tax=Bodo saltans virus TaxID=2024608 RepID=A0A2H4UVP4_9VIRU|nr:hypothetical protein QJ851_gp0842 [Bodo saltans virus]ATZ80905.1 hypothetical protein BMW23_0860 [Bodo saltans virus]
MDIIDINKYKEFKHILLGCKTLNDAKYFGDYYIKSNPESKKLIYGMLYGKKYINVKDSKSFQKIISKCYACKYYEDVMEIIKEYFPNNDENNIQLKTLIRIAKMKNNFVHEIKKDINVKKCPHCGCSQEGDQHMNYIVCGYANSHLGYDWFGCQKDWCFECGKMLCKSWNENKLHVEPNKIHNDECCRKHAIVNKHKYPDDYCQCKNKYVHRSYEPKIQ